MRDYLHIQLGDQTVDRQTFTGEQVARSGLFHRPRACGVWCSQGRTTIGRQSPDFFSRPFCRYQFLQCQSRQRGLPQSIDRRNQRGECGRYVRICSWASWVLRFTLHGTASEWTVMHVSLEGEVSFSSADDLMGLSNFDCAAKLHERFGKKVSLGICGPVGEYLGLLSGISFSDTDLRPSRLAARGVGAVMGAKRVKAIVLELNKMPKLHDRKKVIGAVKQYNAMLKEDEIAQNMKAFGTALMADTQNYLGGLPVRNFTAGQLVDPDEDVMRMGGEFIREQNLERGGQTAHACMPGCTIECSNVYVDSEGRKLPRRSNMKRLA